MGKLDYGYGNHIIETKIIVVGPDMEEYQKRLICTITAKTIHFIFLQINSLRLFK